MDKDLGLRIILFLAGLLILAFGIANGFFYGWQFDIVNLITIFVAIVLIVVVIFWKRFKG